MPGIDRAVVSTTNDVELCWSEPTRPEIGTDNCSDTSYGISCSMMARTFVVMQLDNLGSIDDDNLSGETVKADSNETHPRMEAKFPLSMSSNREYTFKRRP